MIKTDQGQKTVLQNEQVSSKKYSQSRRALNDVGRSKNNKSKAVILSVEEMHLARPSTSHHAVRCDIMPTCRRADAQGGFIPKVRSPKDSKQRKKFGKFRKLNNFKHLLQVIFFISES